MKGNERFIKPSINLEKLKTKEFGINLINKGLLAEVEMSTINGSMKYDQKFKYKVMVFQDVILVLKKKVFSHEIIEVMAINSMTKVTVLPDFKNFPNVIKITNNEKCIIFMAF